MIHAEITRLRALKTNWETQFAVHGEEEFVHALKIILDVLRDMVDRCPVLSACYISQQVRRAANSCSTFDSTSEKTRSGVAPS